MSDDTFTCVIHAPDYETLRKRLAKIAFDFGVASAPPGAPATTEENAAPKGRRGRPPRSAEINKDDDDPLADEPTSTEPGPKEFTMDDAKDAGRMVLAKKGVDVLKDVLKNFAVTKVADLKLPQFEGFIQACADTEKV